MPDVSVAISFTLNLGNYQSAKYELGVTGINTSQPLAPQLHVAEEYLTATAEWMGTQLFNQLQQNSLVDAVRSQKS